MQTQPMPDLRRAGRTRSRPQATKIRASRMSCGRDQPVVELVDVELWHQRTPPTCSMIGKDEASIMLMNGAG